MNWYEKNQLNPQVEVLAPLAQGMTGNQLKALVHFKGFGGARTYLTKGEDNTQSHNISIPNYIKSFSGGGIVDPITDWHKQWMQSPMYKKMNEGEEDFTEQRLSALDSVGINFIPPSTMKFKYKTPPSNLGVYDANEHSVNINERVKSEDLINVTKAHEIGHARNKGDKFMSKQDKALVDPEQAALILQARYEAQQQGVYNPFEQPFKEEYLKDAKENGGLRNLLKMLGKDKTVEVMNSVSQNTPAESSIAKTGGEIDPPTKRKPVFVTDKNDPRLRAYNDSLSAYNSGNRNYNNFKKTGKNEFGNPVFSNTMPLPTNVKEKHFTQEEFFNFNVNSAKQRGASEKLLNEKIIPMLKKQMSDIDNDVKNQPIGYKVFSNNLDGQHNKNAYDFNGFNYAISQYKKPVQPVVYKKSETQQMRNMVVGTEKDFDRLNEQSPLIKDNDGTYKNDLGITFKFAPKPPEQKDYPIVTRPKAQVRGTISGGEMSPDTTKSGASVFGPANSLIGYWKDNQFYPADGAPGKINQADLDLKNNPEELNKFLKEKGLIQKNKLKKGGIIEYKEGGEYEIDETEMKRLKDLGYDFDIL